MSAILFHACQSMFTENSFENRKSARISLLYMTLGAAMGQPVDNKNFFRNRLWIFFLKGIKNQSIKRLILSSKVFVLSLPLTISVYPVKLIRVSVNFSAALKQLAAYSGIYRSSWWARVTYLVLACCKLKYQSCAMPCPGSAT